MGWTDARVETLRTLWQDGLSASTIATQLGGVSRNAVIGKIHRLRIGGELARKAGNQGRRSIVRIEPSAPRRIAAAVGPGAEVYATPFPFADSGDVSGLSSRRLRDRYADMTASTTACLTLGRHSCKWPIGNPGEEGFSFCGGAQARGAFCVEHAPLAYVPQAAKHSEANLYRSLRRYI